MMTSELSKNRFRTRSVGLLGLVSVLWVALLLQPAAAALKIDITQGNVQPLPIAVLDFVSEDGVGSDLAQVIVADLERSGLFRPIEREAYIEAN